MTTLEETNYLKTEKTNDESEGEKKGSKPDEPTPGELDVVTSVFKSFETGIREGSMFAKVSLSSFSFGTIFKGEFDTFTHTSI